MLSDRTVDPSHPCAGDFCKIARIDGIWIPYAGLGGRSDGTQTNFYKWRFVRHPDLNESRTFLLSDVVAVYSREESEEFWPKVDAWVKAGAHSQHTEGGG